MKLLLVLLCAIGIATADFKCTSEGFFPTANNCQRYYFCDSDGVSTQYECPPPYLYDTLDNNCKRNINCVPFKCTATTMNSFIVHPTNPSIYAFCDAAQTAILFKCPRKKQFSMSTFGCRYVCEAEGYFAGSTDDQVFQCTKPRLGEWVQTIYKNEMLCGSN